jgi:hypothetical protein
MGERRILVEPHAELEGRRLEAPSQLGRMHGAAVRARPDRPLVKRRGDLGLGLVPVEIGHVVAVALVQLELLLEAGQVSFVDGHRELPAPFELGVDVVAREGVGEALGVVVAEPLELLQVAREDALGVGQAVHN